MPKSLTMWIKTNYGKFLKEVGILDHLICLLRNLYAGQEATVRIGHGTTNWFQIGKGVCQGCILSPCLFNLYAEYIMRNAGLEESQGGIKIASKNINNFRYTDDTTLMAESEEELESLLIESETLCEKARVGCFKRTASKHVYYLGWNRSPAQVGCMRQVLRPGALGRPRGIEWRGRWEGGWGWGTHVNPWLIHFNVWQNPLQYCKVISLQLIKITK